MPSTNIPLFQLPHNEVEDFTVQLGFSDSDESVSSCDHRSKHAQINELEREVSELKRQLATAIHLATTSTKNCNKSTAINTSAASTIPINSATTQGKDKVTERIHQLAGKFTILPLDPKYQLADRFNSVEGKQQGDYLNLLKFNEGMSQARSDAIAWVQTGNGEIYYEPFTPILHHNDHGKAVIYKLFLNPVLIQVYKSIVHGQGSLDQPNHLRGAKESRWGISKITSEAIAMTAICAHFALSHDPQFQCQGSATCIDYEADFQTYLEFLLVDNGIVKNIFSFWNQELFSGATTSTTSISQGPQSSVKAVLAELKSTSVCPMPLPMAIADPFSTSPLPNINPLLSPPIHSEPHPHHAPISETPLDSIPNIVGGPPLARYSGSCMSGAPCAEKIPSTEEAVVAAGRVGKEKPQLRP
ncbi:hypothetical protein BU17DRAFT_64073 [Hysterangium stoloniferum]|nr:hypothetical protein BU17DRAFT_64073 [Hysterangium stoloniferum]